MKIFNNFNALQLICFASIKQFISFLNQHLKIFIICYSLEIFEFVIKQRNIEILEVIIQKNHRKWAFITLTSCPPLNLDKFWVLSAHECQNNVQSAISFDFSISANKVCASAKIRCREGDRGWLGSQKDNSFFFIEIFNFLSEGPMVIFVFKVSWLSELF